MPIELILSSIMNEFACYKDNILGKKSMAHSANASIISGQRLHKSMDMVGEKNVMNEAISKTSSNTSANSIKDQIRH